ncbi:MAG: hypothetical protein IJB55_01435, partial [Firmicutes bacterium]|nr:hypothetical protein [Bacillota bacterium]
MKKFNFRNLYFALSLALLFTFADSAVYIFLAIHHGLPTADQPTPGQLPYQTASDISPRVQCVTAEDELVITETYTQCGHTEETHLSGASEFVSLSYDQLTAEGWDVAETGEQRLKLSRTRDALCPTEAACRLICLTDRGVAVYQGTIAHRGNMLMEMPLQLSELPPELTDALAADGYQLASEDELNAVLESLDELAAPE